MGVSFGSKSSFGVSQYRVAQLEIFKNIRSDLFSFWLSYIIKEIKKQSYQCQKCKCRISTNTSSRIASQIVTKGGEIDNEYLNFGVNHFTD